MHTTNLHQEHINYLENLLKQNNISFTPLDQKNSKKSEKNNENSQKKTKNTQNKPFQTNLDEQNILSRIQIERYCRQMQLEEVSLEGQIKIAQTKVLVIGAGGIGAPALLYLAGMGVQKIGIIDGDTVDESNLHRQIIHAQNRLGVKKVESALETLKHFNNRIEYQLYPNFLTNKNANEIFKNYDIILDASDNPKTRYLVNDAAITNKKILVSGSAIGWEGQLTVYGYKNGPCYRCLFPKAPTGAKTCGEAGVIGMLPGTIGILEALETLKIIIGLPGVLSQRLLLFDGKDTTFKNAKLRPKQAKCEVCGENPTITNVENYDYDEFINENCLSSQKPSGAQTYTTTTWPEFIENFKKNEKNFTEKNQLVDVRFETQARLVHLKNFQNIPFDKIVPLKTKEQLETKFDPSKKIYIHCRKGINSKIISQKLKDSGFDVTNIQGGIEEYAKQYDDQIPFF